MQWWRALSVVCSSVRAGRVLLRAACCPARRRRPSRDAARVPVSPPARASARAPTGRAPGFETCNKLSYEQVKSVLKLSTPIDRITKPE